jgi:hypothetical protein
MVVLAAMLRELAQIRNAGNNLTLKAVVLQSASAWPAAVLSEVPDGGSPRDATCTRREALVAGSFRVRAECALGVRRLVRCGIEPRARTGGPATDQMASTGPPTPGGPVRGKVCLRTNRHQAVMERNL